MTKKIYTFRAKQTTYGTVSVEAETIEEARAMRLKLQESGEGIFNAEMGSGEVFIDATAGEDISADDGTHMFNTPRKNAEDNMEQLETLND